MFHSESVVYVREIAQFKFTKTIIKENQTMENNDEGRRAGAGTHGETFYGTHESENNMVMSEKVI